MEYTTANQAGGGRGSIVYAGSGGGAQTIPQAPSPVPNALSNLSSAQERLHDRISLLTQRLDALLSPLPPVPVDAASPKHSLALQIEAEAHSVAHAADRVNSLIDRLEV